MQSETPPGPSPTAELTYHSAVSKVIGTIHPVIINPKVNPKSSARVVTSEECRKEIMEKEEKKKEALRLKEERKAEQLRNRRRDKSYKKKRKKNKMRRKKLVRHYACQLTLRFFANIQRLQILKGEVLKQVLVQKQV